MHGLFKAGMNGTLARLARFPLASDRPWIGQLFGLTVMGLALALRFALDDSLPPGFPYLTFFPAIVITAFLFGLRAGTVAAILGFVCSWYWFIPPPGFAINGATAMALGLYVFVVAVDLALIHLMQRALRQLSAEQAKTAALAENREVLFRELQHRVGNNLQMVGAILSLQKRKLTDAEARAGLEEAVRRVGLIGRIQRQLYDPDGAQIALGSFLKAIVHDVIEASGHPVESVSVQFPAGIELEATRAVPVALIVSEAIANAIEHGLPESGGAIAVAATCEPDRIIIRVADNGSGLPAGFDPAVSDSLGLRLSHSLVRNLGGHYDLARVADETVATITLPREAP